MGAATRKRILRGGAGDCARDLYLRLSTRVDGRDPARQHQCCESRRPARPHEPDLAWARLPRLVLYGCRAPQCRHALFGDVFRVSKEPMVFSVPDSGGRYYLLQMLDMWTDVFAAPGKRTTGTGAQTFAVTGPGWQGQLPPDVDEIKSPTGMVMLIGRTQTNGKAYYAAVHQFQNGIEAAPLGQYGKPYTPPQGKVNPEQDMSAPLRRKRSSRSSRCFSEPARWSTDGAQT